MAGRTSLIIAHRLSTVQGADRILVLKDGRILQEGSHAALLREGGLYADLYRLQFPSRGAEPDGPRRERGAAGGAEGAGRP